jgi:cell division protein FtsB
MADEVPVGERPEQDVDPRPRTGAREAQVTTIRKAILGGALVALVVGGASSLATARLTDRQSDLDAQRAEITQLASQVSQQQAEIARSAGRVSQQEAQIAELASRAGDGADEVDRLTAEIAAQQDRIYALEAEKASLEEQLSEILNPAPGPAPTALLTAHWVQRYGAGSAETAVCVEVENTSDGDVSISYSYSQFSAFDGANFAYPPRLHSPGYSIQLDTPLMSGQLSPGEKRRGELLYDVPELAVLTKLVWRAGFGEMPEIAIDLPAAGYYSYLSEC